MYFDKEERRQAVKSFSRIHGGLVLYSIIATVAIIVLQIAAAFVLDEATFNSFAGGPYYVWVLQVLSMYVIAFPLFLLMVKGLPSADREKSSISLKEFGYIFLVSEAIMLSGSIFSNWITEIIRVKLNAPVSNTTSDLILVTPPWVIILVVVIIGPIVEELIFRKVMIDKLSIYGDRLAVVVSALAFGLFHGNFFQLFYATALGLVLGYLYTKTRRSIYNCLLHMAVNFMGTVPALLMQDSLNRINAAVEEDGLVAANDLLLVYGLSLLQYALAIVGVFVLIVATFKRAYSFSDEQDIRIPIIHRPRVLLLNFGTLLFITYFIANCILSLFV